MLRMQWTLVAAAGLVMATAAKAEDKSTFTLHYPVLGWSSMDQKSKVDDGDEVKETVTSMDTAAREDGYASIGFNKMNLYIYPFSDDETVRSFSLSYDVSDMIEVGLDIGLNSWKMKEAKTDGSSNVFGFFVTAAMKAGGMDMEGTLVVDSVTRKSKEYSEEAKDFVKTNESGMLIKPRFLVLYPLTKNFSYAGGLSYTMWTNEEKESKTKTSMSGLGLELFSARLELD